MGPLSGLRGAVAFLTRIPADRGHGAADVARAIPWFPVVGAMVGLAVAGLFVALGLLLPPLVAAVLAVAGGTALTGALHEDGLADLADALGGRTAEDARRIMKDPSHGTYGVLALVVSVAARAGAVAALGPWAAVAWVPAAHAASRGAAVGLLAPRTSGADGLGSATAAHLERRATMLALAVGLLLSTLGVGLWVIGVAVLVLAARVAVGWLASRRLGGATGDVVGAAQQVGEVLVLLLGAAAATQGWAGAVWWR